MNNLINDHRIFIPPNEKIKINNFKTDYTAFIKNKEEAKELLEDNISELSKLQDVIYAHNKYSVLIIFQAMDAAGKDGTIKHVMSGLNPQGCQVFSFKTPNETELDHDYLWRTYCCLPERGRFGIFNRSYYEEVLIVKVHPELIYNQRIPDYNGKADDEFWKKRYRQINDMEKHLTENGAIILKFFLNISKSEQKKRFIDRIDNPAKNWKFSINDLKERKYWDNYMTAYGAMISETSTEYAPWFIIPADNKWFMRYAVSNIIINKLKNLNINYPQLNDDDKLKLKEYKKLLENE